MIERDDGVALAIKRAGGVVRLAKALRLSHGTVSRWRRVPAEHLPALRRSLGLSASELRPDLASQWVNPDAMTCQPVATADLIASELGARAAASAERVVAEHSGKPVEAIGRTNCAQRSLAIYLACSEVEGPGGIAPSKRAVADHFQVFHQSVSRTVQRVAERRDTDPIMDLLCERLGQRLRERMGAGHG